jgi:uncharacterized damage-inducible protein DinB
MDAIAQSHARILDLNASLIVRAVDGLTHEELLRQPGERGNPMLWIASHVVATRGGLLTMLGASWDAPAWAADFTRGNARPAADAYMPVSRVLATLTATGGSLAAALETVSEAQWSGPSPRPLPVADTSLRGAFAFFVFHETYHVGQLAYLRRWLGYPGLVG